MCGGCTLQHFDAAAQVAAKQRALEDALWHIGRVRAALILPAIHGGMTGAFLETTAIVGVTRELGALAPPKPIGLTINYLRSGRALDSYARVSIVKQGRRVVAFEAQAWQDDPTKPIASAFGHFMLRKTPGADED